MARAGLFHFVALRPYMDLEHLLPVLNEMLSMMWGRDGAKRNKPGGCFQEVRFRS